MFGIILLLVILIIWLVSHSSVDKSQVIDKDEREKYYNDKRDQNNVAEKRARVEKIKAIIGFDFGNDYIEIINELRFHPDMPENVVLEFDEKSFKDLINFVISPSSDKLWVGGADGLTLRNPEGDPEKGNYFLEGIELVFATKRLEYHFTGC